MQEATIAAIATAPGAGGIAVVRLSGAESYPIAARVFRPANAAKKVEDAKGYTAMYGTFREGDEAFDEGVALFFRAPHSYTGEDVVELSCHGGSAVARRLVEACLAAGAQPAAPGEYTRRAFLNGKLGLTQAEAVMDLISADGRQGAALANASLGGALAKKIAAEKEALTALQAHLAAWVDFPEEDVPELDEAHLQTVLGGVKDELDTLIQNYDAGAVLREGVDCAIVGRPNAGKSTLLNLLAGFDRAIVTPVAGTTRDVVEQAVRLGDIRLNLFDTAGLRDTEDLIEAEGIRRSWKKLDEAGLVLAVFDGSAPLTREDFELARKCAGQADPVRRGDHRTLFRDGAAGLLPRGGDPEADLLGGGAAAGHKPDRPPRRQPFGSAAAGRRHPCAGGRCRGAGRRRRWVRAGRRVRLCGRRAGCPLRPDRRKCVGGRHQRSI